MQSKILLGNFFQNSSMKRKKNWIKLLNFFLSMKENFVEGKESDGVLKIALGSSLWLSPRFSTFPVGQIWEYWLILIQRESDSSETQFPPLGICSFCYHKDYLGTMKNRTTRDGPFQEQCIIATRKTQEFFWTAGLVFLSLSKWCWIKPPWLPWLYSFLDWMWELHSLFVIWKLPGRTVFLFYAFLSFGYG